METILIVAAAVMILAALSITIVGQGNVAVITMFGKYRRIMYPGIHLKWPVVEGVFKRISTQNRSVELEFTAITCDQANVNFKSLILYAAKNEAEETLKKIAFRFIDEKSFMQTLVRSVEGSIRSFVATKNQSEILRLRHEIVQSVAGHLEHSLNDWGFHLLDLQVNDISFDEAIMRSMAQVVSSSNMKLAAENEAQAQYITKTRIAEAEAKAIRLKAEAEKDAYDMKGAGNALFREQAANGLARAGKIMEGARVDPSFMLFTMWLDGMKHIAEHGKGNVLFFDGSTEGMDKTLRQMHSLHTVVKQNGELREA